MNRIITTAALLATAAPLFAASGELKTAAQKLSKDHGESIVWLTVISKTIMSVDGDAPAQLKAALASQDKESRSEATGTIVDATGLIVTSLPSIDKSAVMDGKTVNTPAGPIKLKASSEIKEVKVIMADGTEIPADLVLKDADLGLGFIKVRMDSPEAKGVTFNAINLADSSPGALVDDCIALGRLDQNLNREASVSTSEISGITTKPRTFYRLVNNDSSGCPVFLASGKLLGISVVRQPSGTLEGGTISLAPVVLPAADVSKIAEQAKTAQPIKTEAAPKKDEEKKDGDKKDEKKSDEKKDEPKKDASSGS
ncbi:MAG TPA: serine protease [Verrucomicrobiales bacterium]|jgi:S1-C subfamily serine protease|nr:serine protease [Verrucomicrobiales bacterium]